MKEQILKLREEGKSYNEIVEILGCSKSTVSYHCGEGQKKKTLKRQQKRRKQNPLIKKLDQYRRKLLYNKGRDFQRNREAGIFSEGRVYKFTEKEVYKKIGKNPSCYLTGRPIDLEETNSYHFDHIVPLIKGGDNSLENLGLACKDANIGKGMLLKEDFIKLCKEVLEHNGYKVNRE